MADRTFPDLPPAPFLRPTPVELVMPRRPLVAIFQSLGISIHDMVNDPRHRWNVRGFYRITRRIENEAWLRRRFEEKEYEAWIDAHL